MGKKGRRGRGGPRPEAPDQPGPSWAEQPTPLLAPAQQPQQQQERTQHHQERAHQPSHSQGRQEEASGGSDFTSRMGGLRVDDDQSGKGLRRGRGWTRSQSQQSQRPGMGQRPAPQQQFERPQSQPMSHSRSQPQSQPQSQQSPVRPSVPSVSGAWARGPPLDLQKGGQDKPKQPDSESASQPQSEKTTPVEGDPEKAKSGAKSGDGEGGEPKKPEDKTAKKKTTKSFPESEMESNFLYFAPRIYAKKRTGRTIEVLTNFFPLRIENANIIVYHYDVTFEPEVPKSLNRKAWNKASDIFFPNRITVYDGMSNAFTRVPLDEKLSCRGEINLYLPDSCKSRVFSVTIKEVRRIKMNTLLTYKEKLEQSQTIEDRKKALPLAEVSIIEVILKNWPANNLIQNNRVFFPKREMNPRITELSDRLELRYGCFQSAFLGSKLYLNFDVAHRPFYKSNYIQTLIRDMNQGRLHQDPEELNHYIKGAKIEYSLPDERGLTVAYRANKFVGPASTQTFEKDGKKMTVAEYFDIEKDFKLRYPHLPVLWVGPINRTIYLPLELTRLAEDQLYKGVLNPGETRRMVSGATTDARRRKTETIQAFTSARFERNPYLKEFGITVAREMETVKARVLEPPKLKSNAVINVREGSWKSRGFLDAKSFNKWCIVNLDKTVDRNGLVSLQRSIQAKAREYNMPISEPAISTVDKRGTVSYYELQKVFATLRNMTIVIVVISEMKGLYSKVKTICETQEGILTQCIKGRNVMSDPRKIMTTLDNLLLKINAKLGGTNHTLNQSSIPPCLEGYVMIVGADVTHAGPGSRIPSVAAVATCNEVNNFQYGIRIRVQHGEIISDLLEIMKANLQSFLKARRRYPDKIFFFRDGVSEGEMEKVLKTEYKDIRAACDQLRCNAKITLLVVQKRHHTRFFPTSTADEEGKTFNVPVGTCVDSDIVHPGGLDFYLLSHGSLLGTARPTRYRLLHDDNRLTDDELEQLTFYLCHLYSRCNRSVSYPSPTYNAHLAAFRARAYLEGLNLTDKDDLTHIQAQLTDCISTNYPMYFI